jgi:methylamine dehydrogenase accessory protein MauD
MIQTLIISNIISWIAIIGLSALVFALARQIGVIHERIKPVGALALGQVIAAGEEAPQFVLPSLNGGTIALGGVNPQGLSTLVFFLSDQCPVCKTLLPLLRNMQRQEPWLRLVFASDGDPSGHRELIEHYQLAGFPYLLSSELGMAYQIGKLPYAVLIGSDGIISAHGLVNNREHLESLFAAAEARQDLATAYDATQAHQDHQNSVQSKH